MVAESLCVLKLMWGRKIFRPYGDQSCHGQWIARTSLSDEIDFFLLETNT